jgi:hypothetical protein
MALPSPFSRGSGIVSEALHALVSQVPSSFEAPSAHPLGRSRLLGKTAAFKAAALSGSFTLPPGPFGMATVLPDLLAVWRIQQQLVADIASTFGKTDALTPETMVICLFKHGGAALTRPLFAREGHEVVVQRITHRTLLQLLEKIAVRLTQRIAAKSLSRWLPVVGAIGAGAYSYYDTTQVAANTISLFSQELKIVPPPGEETASAGRRRPRSGPTARAARFKRPAAKAQGTVQKTGQRVRRRKTDV